MIKYIPIRKDLSSSVKEEQVFDTMDQLKLFILETNGRIALYINRKPYIPTDINIGDIMGDDRMIGWKNVRSISLKHNCIGYCGE